MTTITRDKGSATPVTALPPEYDGSDDSVGIAFYWRVLRERWPFLLRGAIAGALLAAGYLVVVGQPATAETDVRISTGDPTSSTASPSDLIDAQTEVQLATSFTVAQAASAALENVSPAELRSGLQVGVVNNTAVVSIRYTAGSPEAARAGADAVAQAYLDYRGQLAASDRDAAVARIDARVEALQEANATDAAAVAADDLTATQAATNADARQVELDALAQQRASLTILQASSGSVISTAADNSIDAAANPVVVVATGVVGGLILGATAAYGANWIDRRRRTAADVARRVGRVIADTTGELTPAMAADALRTARERVLAEVPDNLSAIAVIDCSVSAAGSWVPEGLADAFDSIGRIVNVVTPADVLHSRELVEGRTGPNDRRLFVVNVAPFAPHSEALLAARLADAAVLIVERGATRLDRAAALAQELADAGTPVAGVVLVAGQATYGTWAAGPVTRS